MVLERYNIGLGGGGFAYYCYMSLVYTDRVYLFLRALLSETA